MKKTALSAKYSLAYLLLASLFIFSCQKEAGFSNPSLSAQNSNAALGQNNTAKANDEYKMSSRSTHVTDFVRDGVMAMQLGNYYFTFGGWRDWPESQNDVYRSAGNLSTWEKMPNAPWHPRHVSGCVKKDGKV